MTIADVLQWLFGPFGLLMCLLFILWSGWKRIWVFGSYHQEMMAALRAEFNARLEEKQEQNEKLDRRLDQALAVAERESGLSERALTALLPENEQARPR